MNFKKILITLLCCGTVGTTAVAKEKAMEAPREKQISEYLAIATAKHINRLGNVDQYLNWITTFATKKEVSNLEKYFNTLGVNRDTKFPKMHFKGNMAYFDKSTVITFTNENHLFFNGKRFEASTDSIDKIVMNFCETVKCKLKEVSALENFLMPKAHALNITGRQVGFTLAGAGIGALLGGKNNRLLGAGLGAVGGLFLENMTDGDKENNWLGKNMFAGFHDPYYYPDDGIYCQHDRYQLRGRRDYFDQRGVMPYNVSQRMYGRNIGPCNDERRQHVERIRRQYRPRPGEPRTPPGSIQRRTGVYI